MTKSVSSCSHSSNGFQQNWNYRISFRHYWCAEFWILQPIELLYCEKRIIQDTAQQSACTEQRIRCKDNEPLNHIKYTQIIISIISSKFSGLVLMHAGIQPEMRTTACEVCLQLLRVMTQIAFPGISLNWTLVPEPDTYVNMEPRVDQVNITLSLCRLMSTACIIPQS